jgi:penicillin-binding protein 1A
VKKWFLSNPAFGETEQDRQTLLFEGGLKIYTTIDMDLQRAAEQARDDVLPDVPGLDAAVVTMDPTNGNVLAMVGGRDFFGTSPYAKVNLADGDGRQTGSSIKAVALAAALQSGWDPTRTYAAPSSIELKIPGDTKPWSVRGGAGGGQTTLIEATRRSLNTVYAQMILDLGPQKLTDMAAKLGIKHPVAPIPAAVLGTENVTMLDMATAFSTFASRGLERDPVMVTKIVRADGTTLYEHHDTQTRVLDTKIADQLNWILTGVISGGTGTSAKFGRPAAGKTGSAQNNADATFIGYTPQRTTAVWVGFPEGQVPMVPPRTPISVFGGTYPARIFSKVMAAAHKDLPTVDFADPPPSSTTTTTTILGAAAPVPSVQGQTAEQATATLQAAGFGVTVTNVETDEFTPGVVANQAPKAGSEAPAGSKVTIEVATAPAQKAPITVPNVTGLTRADARGRLLSGGFSVLEVFDAAPPGTSPTPASGTVWRQAPAPGSPKPTDGVVQISIQP